VAEFAGAVTAVEVSPEIVPADLPSNVDVVISDGVSVPVAPGSADLVYSNQLMEHLHPDDAIDQLRGIVAALRPGGRYICITPNRLTGPHDISAAFDDRPRGFHLREYSYRELRSMFADAGFRGTHVVERAQGRSFGRLADLVAGIDAERARGFRRWGDRAMTLPLAPYLLGERLVERLPRNGRDLRVVRRMLDTIRVVAER